MYMLRDFYQSLFGEQQETARVDPDDPSKLLVDPYSHNPTKAWQKRQERQTVQKITPIDPLTPISDNHVRFVCISDTHNIHYHHTVRSHPDQLCVPDGDVLLHGGDFTMSGLPDEMYSFNQFLESLPHKQKVVISGNHDLTLDTDFIEQTRWTFMWKLTKENFEDRLQAYGVTETRELLTNCLYLQDDLIDIYGIKIYGSPWLPGSGRWGFSLPRGEALIEAYNDIPEETDILMTHGPPLGYGDMSVGKLAYIFPGAGLHHAGCVDLLNNIQRRVKPAYHVYGHIHEGYGVTTDGTTTFVNASICTLDKRQTNRAIVFDIPLPEGHSKDEAVKWLTPYDSSSSEEEEEDSESYSEDSEEYEVREEDIGEEPRRRLVAKDTGSDGKEEEYLAVNEETQADGVLTEELPPAVNEDEIAMVVDETSGHNIGPLSPSFSPRSSPSSSLDRQDASDLDKGSG